MKRQNKERWKVKLSLRVVGRWKGKGMRKVGGSAIIKKKVNVKKNYRKIEKKNDNNVDANVVQCEYSNIKYYASAFSNTSV